MVFHPFSSRIARVALLAASTGAATFLTGCVVAPLGPPVAVIRPAPVYIEPAPAVVVRPYGYYGYPRPHGYGYYGGRGHRHYDGGR
jgi:hypothetical protein